MLSGHLVSAHRRLAVQLGMNHQKEHTHAPCPHSPDRAVHHRRPRRRTTGLAPGATAAHGRGRRRPRCRSLTPEGQISSYVVNVRKVKDQQIPTSAARSAAPRARSSPSGRRSVSSSSTPPTNLPRRRGRGGRRQRRLRRRDPHGRGQGGHPRHGHGLSDAGSPVAAPRESSPTPPPRTSRPTRARASSGTCRSSRPTRPTRSATGRATSWSASSTAASIPTTPTSRPTSTPAPR